MDRITDLLGRRLTGYFPGAAAVDIRLVARTRMRWSEHLEYLITRRNGSEPGRILVKVPCATSLDGRQQEHHRCPDTEESGRAEYEALQRLHAELAGTGDPTMTAIRPLDYLVEQRAIVMERLPAENLFTLLERTPAGGPAGEQSPLARAVHDAGGLLRALHLIPQGDLPRQVTFSASAAVSTLSAWLERVASHGGPAGYLRQFAGRYAEIAAALEVRGEAVMLARLHGDYYLKNIAVTTSGAVFTMDTTLQERGPVLQDVTSFLVGLTDTRRAILRGEAAGRRRRTSELAESFLGGYFAGSPRSREMLDLYLVIALLKRWYEVLTVAAASRWRWLSPLVRGLRINRYMMRRLERIQSGLRRHGAR